MRIDGTFGPDRFNVSKSEGKPEGSKKSSSSKSTDGPSSAAQHVSVHQALIQIARQAPEVDRDAVAEAKADLEQGRLDTPESARQAAAAILDLGV